MLNFFVTVYLIFILSKHEQYYNTTLKLNPTTRKIPQASAY